MVAEKGHPHPPLKAARQMQKPRGKCKSRAVNAKSARQMQKNCVAASILYMLYPTISRGDGISFCIPLNPLVNQEFK